MSKIDNFSKEEIENALKNANSQSECCRLLGLTDKGRWWPDKIKQRCNEENILIPDYSNTRYKNSHSFKKYLLDDVLIENSSYKNITSLKERLIKEKRLEYKCALCGNIGFWNNKILSLQLDHINGNHLDHRIENLRFLCPNCHSQTETFGNKNRN